MRHIASYLNRAGDIQSDVTLTDRGTYAVRIHDLDACETLPAMVIFTNELAARDYALKCVTADDDEDLPF